MKFDRAAPGGGVEVNCRLENGKAFLEWEFYFDNREESCGIEDHIRLTLTDRRGETVLEGIRLFREEEPLQSVLLQPQLWQGPSAPWLYALEAVLADREGRCLDRIVRQLPLRSMGCMEIQGKRELLLNGETFSARMVGYTFPAAGTGAARQQKIMEDMRWLLKMGANSIAVDMDVEAVPDSFPELCDRLGFLLFYRRERNGYWAWAQDGEEKFRIQCEEKVPSFRGEQDSLFRPGSSAPTALYYQYRAKWSREPFVYIVPESIQRGESCNYTVKCYSNCDRVALYSDGSLFAFQRGEIEFVFQEVPARTPGVMLTAEGDGCSEALSVHKSFLAKSCNSTQLTHTNVPGRTAP
ncbi:hypothetical protein [Acetatifactor muris]|uniref:hypothetical protein n=1 Tax=Acetatifactor muris TaxID=879566 RepID=UPI0023EFCAF2|nr:hypothetical protein [Acetatifactor muris]